MFSWKYYFKRFLCKFIGFPLTEICQKCGRQVECVWHTSDGLWNTISRITKLDRKDIKYNSLCVRCFGELSLREYNKVMYFTASWMEKLQEKSDQQLYMHKFQKELPQTLENLRKFHEESRKSNIRVE